MVWTLVITRRQWPKRHAHVVEECRAIGVRDVLGDLDSCQRRMLVRWQLPRHPTLALVARQIGPVPRWWFRCPTCRKCSETLFVPPNVAEGDWRCRSCWNLIYASQRFGRRHPLRRVLTPRKRITRAKAEGRRERQEAKEARRVAKEREFIAGATEAARQLRMQAEQESRERAQRLADAQARTRAMLDADAADNREFLAAIDRGDLSPRSSQGRAARMLERAAKAYGISF